MPDRASSLAAEWMSGNGRCTTREIAKMDASLSVTELNNDNTSHFRKSKHLKHLSFHYKKKIRICCKPRWDGGVYCIVRSYLHPLCRRGHFELLPGASLLPLVLALVLLLPLRLLLLLLLGRVATMTFKVHTAICRTRVCKHGNMWNCIIE